MRCIWCFLLIVLVLFSSCHAFANDLTASPQQHKLSLAQNNSWPWLIDWINNSSPASERRDAHGRFLEKRVLFDEDSEWASSREATDRIVTELKRAGFNVYVPCVWHGYGTLFPSRVAQADPRYRDRFLKGYDPLAYLVRTAHEKGIEVHAWFTVMRRDREFYPQFYSVGVPKDAFDVHNQQFRAFIVGLMLDLVERYPVDGVNLDYIRSMGTCRSASCQNDYRLRYKRMLMADLIMKQGGMTVPTIQDWNATAVREIVSSFSRQAKAKRPRLVVSVDSLPHDGTFILEGQDSVGWTNANIIDAIFVMDYGVRIDAGGMDKVRSLLDNPEKMNLLLATYDIARGGQVVHRDGRLLADYVRLVRRRWPGSGIAFYHRKQLSDEQIDILRSDVFREDADPDWRKQR